MEVTTLSSNYHIEINPSDVGTSDRYVIQEVITEIAQTQNVNSTVSNKENALSPKPNYKGPTQTCHFCESELIPFDM